MSLPSRTVERTFVGGVCAVCEEPLEHKLLGEGIFQFSCGHVAHEDCFYEYLRDPDQSQYCPLCESPLGLDWRGGGRILDLGKARRETKAILSDQLQGR